MKKVFFVILLICAMFSVSEALDPILRHYRVGRGFNVHFEGLTLVYEGKIDGEYGDDIVLLYQNDLTDAYRIADWRDEKTHGNIRTTVTCVRGSRVIVRFQHLYYDDKWYRDWWGDNDRNRTYYFNVNLEYFDGEKWAIEVLPIRFEQHQNFGSGCAAVPGLGLLLLLVPLFAQIIRTRHAMH